MAMSHDVGSFVNVFGPVCCKTFVYAESILVVIAFIIVIITMMIIAIATAISFVIVVQVHDGNPTSGWQVLGCHSGRQHVERSAVAVGVPDSLVSLTIMCVIEGWRAGFPGHIEICCGASAELVCETSWTELCLILLAMSSRRRAGHAINNTTMFTILDRPAHSRGMWPNSVLLLW